MKKTVILSLLSALLVTSLVEARPSSPGDARGQARGQQALKGGNGVFGAIYTMNDGLNLQVLSARLSLEPHNDYATTFPKSDEKLLIIQYAIKNSQPQEVYTQGYSFTLVDDSEKTYNNEPGSTRLGKNGGAEFSISLKPSQGVGQDSSSPLTVAFRLPARARIKKLMVNQGRKAVAGEAVLRYPLAGEESKNVIAPLPPGVADPKDPTLALEVGQGELGKYLPGGYFALRCESVTIQPDALLNGQKAAEGKQFVVVTMKARNIGKDKTSFFYAQDGVSELPQIRDADGRRYTIVGDSGTRDGKRDELLQTPELEVGEEISYRYFFELPKDARPASFQFGGGAYGHAFRVQL